MGGLLIFSVSLTVISTKTQYLDQVEINFISQLISDVFKFLHKLLKCLKGTAISVSYLPTLFASSPSFVFLVILVLYLKNSELEERELLGSSHYKNSTNFVFFFYCTNKLYIGTTTSRSPTLSICTLLSFEMQLTIWCIIFKCKTHVSFLCIIEKLIFFLNIFLISWRASI